MKKKMYANGIVFLAVFFLLMPCVHAKTKKDIFALPTHKALKTKNSSILKTAWTKGLKAGSPAKRFYPETNAPVVSGNAIFVGTHAGMVYALDRTSGKQLWQYKSDQPISSAPAVTDSHVLVADLGGRILCLSRDTGALVWEQALGKEIVGAPLATGSRVFVVSGDHDVFALSGDSGQILWQKTVASYVKKLTMRGQSPFVFEDGALYVGLADGRLYKLSAGDGHVVWEKNLDKPFSTFKDIDARVVVDGDSLYVGGYFGSLYRLSRGSGAVLWSAEIATGVPVLVTDKLVVATDTNGRVRGVDKATGKELWYNELNGSVLSAPVLVGDKVFVTSFKNEAFLLDAASGDQVQRLSIGDGSINEPQSLGNEVYVFTNGGKVVALRQ